MPELPPRAEVIDALWHVVAPAAGAAVAVYGLLLAVRAVTPHWRRAGPVVSLLAVVAAVAAVNHFRGAFPWQPDRWWHWGLPALTGVALAELVAVLSPKVEVAFLLRGLGAGLTAAIVTPPAWQDDSKLAMPLVGLLIAAVWSLPLSRRASGPTVPVFATSLVCLGAAGVLLHHRSMGFADLLNGLGVGLLVVGLLAWLARVDATPAAAVAAVAAVVLLVMGRALYDSPIPRAAFVLVGVTAPLTALPTRAGRHAGPFTLALVAAQVAAAVALAMRAAPLEFGNEW